MTVAVLERSNDRKVANAVKVSAKGEASPRIKNAFGLLAGLQGSCPGATSVCLSGCYAGESGNGSEMVYPAVKALVTRNLDALKDASLADMVTMLDTMIQDFVRDCQKWKAPKLFRIHWDGDFFSPRYVHAWSKVIESHPDIKFWAYTRVWTAAVYLHGKGFDNLGLFFSGDPENVDVARRMESLGINVAYVDNTFADGKALFPKATRCPENNRNGRKVGALPLIDPKGSACARCGLCVDGRKSVLFSFTKS